MKKIRKSHTELSDHTENDDQLRKIGFVNSVPSVRDPMFSLVRRAMREIDDRGTQEDEGELLNARLRIDAPM